MAAQSRMKRWRAAEFSSDPLGVRLAEAVAAGNRSGIDSLVHEGADVNLIGPDKTYPGQMPQRIATR